ncbi:glycosyltransferase family 2 protein [Flavobacterium undicola]|uniref:glycosyltransferase family 2 protein n=1 Tax=Flavobacterium undicola TaxID=1932779 RepID=UPI001376D8D5|nr:glycosyltransferase [Flavobacterium undicola]MBA0882804.1 glycosyltransferase [Flavobacterium undicola]
MLFLLFILSIYFATILLLIYGFTKVKNYDAIGLKPKTTFTIVIPFRNEAENLPLLLESISKMNYPTDLFEVILVDDDSDEKFQNRNSKFQISIIDNIRVSNSPKKDAITTAIPLVKTAWIITTDADCLVPENWLLTLDNYIQTHEVSMIAGAVTYECNNSFLYHFQQLDLASLQGATIGSFGIGKAFMCNGANLAYTKSLFKELNGFEGNNTIASGDDVFLLQKAIARFPKKVHYLKSENTIVSTKPVDNWKALFYQRVRWASKTTSYQSSFGKALGLIVFTGNLVSVLSYGLWVMGFILFLHIFLLFLSKFIIDSILIYRTNRFLTKNKIRYLILSSLFYPFFSVSVALYAAFGKYEWKGRRF